MITVYIRQVPAIGLRSAQHLSLYLLRSVLSLDFCISLVRHKKQIPYLSVFLSLRIFHFVLIESALWNLFYRLCVFVYTH